VDNPDPNKTPTFDEIENIIDQVRGLINQNLSRGLILSELDRLLVSLFNFPNQLLTESIFLEFFPHYLKLLSWYHPQGQPPKITRQLIKNSRRLYNLGSGIFRKNELKLEIKRIEGEFTEVLTGLKGENSEKAGSATVFPVIESVEGSANFTYLDSIDVKVTPSKGGNRFIVHPTFKDEDRALMEQVKTSLEAALKMLHGGREKLPTAFEVQVLFNSKLGVYSGNSFGALLAIHIIIELNKLLKPNILQQIVPSLAFTGAVDASGEIKSVGKKNIVRKVRSVFFSSVSRFVLPKADEPAALSLVTKLQEKWPQRKLEIVGVNNISEIFNRRDVINISRRPIRDRVKDGVKKYRYVSLVLIPMILFLGFLSAREFDTNPVTFELDKTNLKILNKYGVVLWSSVLYSESHREFTEIELKSRIRIIDINGDGVNEVLAAGDMIDFKDDRSATNLLCLSSHKEEMWRFSFKDTVSSPKEKNIPAEYGIKIYDSVTINGEKRLLVWATSTPTYPNALFFIDPLSGEKVSEAVWHAGFINQVGLTDVDGDNLRDIVFCAKDNGFGYLKIIAVHLNISESMIESRSDYMLYGKAPARPLLEIALPVTDYIERFTDYSVDFFPHRAVSVDHKGKMAFYSRFSYDRRSTMYTLILDSKTHEIDYFIEGTYKTIRDSLVNAGKLPLPYTDTKEYTDILKNGVRYKLNGEWVTYAEYKKAKKL